MADSLSQRPSAPTGKIDPFVSVIHHDNQAPYEGRRLRLRPLTAPDRVSWDSSSVGACVSSPETFRVHPRVQALWPVAALSSMPGKSFRIARFAGIPVGVKSLVAGDRRAVPWSLGATYFPEVVHGIAPGVAYAMGLASALLLFASILAHEFGHAIVARRHGIPGDEIDLWLLGGVSDHARRRADPRNPAALCAGRAHGHRRNRRPLWSHSTCCCLLRLPEVLSALIEYQPADQLQ